MPTKIYLKLGDIQGDCKDKGHEDQIQISTWSWGMSRQPVYGAQGNPADTTLNVQDFIISKCIDSSTPRIMEAFYKGEHFDKVILESWTEPDVEEKKKKAVPGKANRPYGLRITLENVIVNMVQTTMSEADSAYSENISLNFARFTFEYLGESGKGPGSRRSQLKWDIVKNSKF